MLTENAKKHLASILARSSRTGAGIGATVRALSRTGLVDQHEAMAVADTVNARGVTIDIDGIKNRRLKAALAKSGPMSRFQMEPPTSEE